MATHPEFPSKSRILEYVFRKMGLPVLFELPLPLKLSGGDYIPAGKDLAFIGVCRASPLPPQYLTLFAKRRCVFLLS